MKIPFKKLSPEAKMPTRGSEGAAGYDLVAVQGEIISTCGGWEMIKTGLAVEIPHGHYGRIAPRSGLALKKGIDVLGGVIDSDYRGEIGVILINHNTAQFVVKPGDKIAQLIIERAFDAEFIEFDSLEETERGSGGFGSTDISHPTPASGGKAI